MSGSIAVWAELEQEYRALGDAAGVARSLFNAGILNPFSLTQTPAALSALDAVSAERAAAPSAASPRS